MTTAERLMKQGEERGLERGLEQAKREDASRMLDKGYPIEDICDITGLSPDEVEELQKG